MASILTHAIITNATAAVDTYISTLKTLYTQLEGIMSTLTSTNFNGDAANGYTAFYTASVKPALEEAGATQALMGSVKDLLANIQTQLLDTVDPQLGQNNQNAGNASTEG